MQDQSGTLAQAFDRQAHTYGTRTFLKDKRDKSWREHSWEAIKEAAGRLRAGLLKLGVKPGDRVGILADNCPEWVIADQAVLGLGAVVVPLYTTSNAEETGQILRDCGARVVAVYGAEMVKKLLALAEAIPEVATIIALNPGADSQEHAPGRPQVTTVEKASASSPAPLREGTSEELATIIYTSGTTGPPKGVMLSHGNILANCRDALLALELNETDTILSFLPLAHSFERTGGYYAVMLAGGTIAYAEGLSHIADNLLEVRPTVLLTVPRLLELIHNRVIRAVEQGPVLKRLMFKAAMAAGNRAIEYTSVGRALPPALALAMAAFRKPVFERIRNLFGGRLRYLISGGAPLPEQIFRFFAAAEVPLVEGYGLTEAAPVVSVNLLAGRTRIGTVGRPLKSVDVRIAPDGELLVRGPNVMKGYYRRGADTAEVLDADGWLHTGDIAQVDGEGYIKITDRKKEIIVLSGGKNVSPANLEMRLTGISCVSQACVVGDGQKHLAALLVPDFDNLQDFLKQKRLEGRPREELLESPAVRAFYRECLRKFNEPLSSIEAISAFSLIARPFTQENGELTPTLKLRRKAVLEHYRELVYAMYRD